MTKKRRDPAFMHAYDPACRVCSTDLATHFRATAAPLAPHLQNPETRGHNWYHGTHGDWDHDQRDAYPAGSHPSGEIPDGGIVEGPDLDEYGTHRGELDKHWNTDLGSHWTSLKHVAHEQFAHSGIHAGSPSSRVATASLHMANPKHYESEHHLTRDAIDWAHSQGHHYITKTAPGADTSREDQERKDFVGTGGVEDDPYGRFSHIPSMTGEYTRRALMHVDQHGPETDDGTHESYLGMHPYRHEITTGFVKHLRDQGHDGIVYGNEHEGPHQHPCAIAFHDTPISQHKWEWGHQSDRPSEQKWPKMDEVPGQQQLPFAVHGLIQHFGGAKGDLPKDLHLTFHPGKREGDGRPHYMTPHHSVQAISPSSGGLVGDLKWAPRDSERFSESDGFHPGEISGVWVREDHRRRGIADAMMEHAKERYSTGQADSTPIHSPELSENGRSWSQSREWHDRNWEDGEESGRDPVEFHDGAADPKSTKHDYILGVLQHFAEAKSIEVAGLCLKARDSGRILLIQRSNEDESDPARGTWEFPGGHIDEGEDPLAAARREFSEETGLKIPDDAEVTANWVSPNGIYQGFVLTIPTEDDLDLNPDHEDRPVKNPDDPKGDDIEVVAWWDIDDLPDMPALRKEVKHTPWKTIKQALLKESARHIRLYRDHGNGMTFCPKCRNREPQESDHPVYSDDESILGPGHIEVCSDCGKTIVNTLGKDAHVLDKWQPTDRLFAPTNGSLDPRLFSGDKIRPEVRDYAMGRLAAWWDGRYDDWRTWSKVYIAGSSISEWWADKSAIQAHAAEREVDPKYRLNDDLDTLIGIEYKGLVEANPQFAGMSPKMVSAHLNAELREHCNLEGVYLNVPSSEVPEWEWAGDPVDGKVRVGPWSSTFYCNPNSYDIRVIKPYAAYNLTDDEWAVRPVSEPTGHKFSPTEWYYFEGVAQQVKGALALPEPARSNRCKRIWEHIHSSRSGAFGPHGQGVFDYRNAVEKYLDQAGLWQQLVDARFPGQKTAGANGDLPEDLQFRHEPGKRPAPGEYDSSDHRIVAHVPDADGGRREIGFLDLDSRGGPHTVNALSVSYSHRRRGVATAMWEHAKTLGYKPQHSDVQFPDGKAWAEKTAAADHDVTYHITDNPHFALDPDHQPEDNAMSINPRERKGLFTTDRPESWVNGHDYARPYIAEIHSPKGTAEDERWGGEKFIPAEHFDKTRVHRVVPLDAHAREQFGGPGWIESHHGTAFDTGEPLRKGQWNEPDHRQFSGYHYDGPDVRDMTPEQHTQHYNRWKGFMTGGRGFGHNEFDDARQTLAEPKDEDFDGEGMFIKRDEHGQKISHRRSPRLARLRLREGSDV